MGLSLGKILFTLVVIYGVWMVFQILQRRALGKSRASPAARAAQAAQDTVRGRMGARQEDPAELDLVPCPACGAYLPRGTPCSCGGKGGQGPG